MNKDDAQAKLWKQEVEAKNRALLELPPQGEKIATEITAEGGLSLSPAVAMKVADFVNANFPPKRAILKPIIQERDLFEIYAVRGAGKTLFALQMACHIASGTDFLKWHASEPRRVLYVDGEMPAALLQYRLRMALKWGGISLDQIGDRLKVVTPDIQEKFMMNLSTPQGQAWLMPATVDADVIFLDSLLTLAPHGKSNDAESFMPMQELLLKLRSQGKTVGFIHHAGKSGRQLGTINKETVLDSVLGLDRAKESGADTAMILHFDKTRNFYGEDAASLLVTLQEDEGWSYQNVENWIEARAVELSNETTMTQREIADELGVDQSTVSRILKRQGKGKKKGK